MLFKNACVSFTEMNLNRGTTKDNFQKKLDALTEEGMVSPQGAHNLAE